MCASHQDLQAQGRVDLIVEVFQSPLQGEPELGLAVDLVVALLRRHGQAVEGLAGAGLWGGAVGLGGPAARVACGGTHLVSAAAEYCSGGRSSELTQQDLNNTLSTGDQNT